MDARGWLWEIRHGGAWPMGDVRQLLVEVSGSARKVADAGGHLPEDTAAAIRSEGRSEVEKVLGLENPPAIVLCGSTGCRPREVDPA